MMAVDSEGTIDLLLTYIHGVVKVMSPGDPRGANDSGPVKTICSFTTSSQLLYIAGSGRNQRHCIRGYMRLDVESMSSMNF